MDISSIRLKNAQSLRDTCSSTADFARKVGKEPTQVRHWFNPNVNKNIGNKIAREIEAAFNKPHGWLDSIHDLNEAQHHIIPNIANLISKATPRTSKALEEINQAAIEGRIDENDVEFLNKIAKKLAHD